MAGVTIDSGPITEGLLLREVPQEKWFELMQVRRGFLRVHLPYDCRRLLEFVEDAEQMYAPLGFASADDFIKSGLQLDPQQVAWALDGLRRMQPDKPIPFERAIEIGKHGGARRGAGRPKKGEVRAIKFQGDNITLNSKRGTSRAYILGRLDGEGFTDLAAKVRAKSISARAAAIEAGISKPRVRRCPKCGHEW